MLLKSLKGISKHNLLQQAKNHASYLKFKFGFGLKKLKLHIQRSLIRLARLLNLLVKWSILLASFNLVLIIYALILNGVPIQFFYFEDSAAFKSLLYAFMILIYGFIIEQLTYIIWYVFIGIFLMMCSFFCMAFIFFIFKELSDCIGPLGIANTIFDRLYKCFYLCGFDLLLTTVSTPIILFVFVTVWALYVLVFSNYGKIPEITIFTGIVPKVVDIHVKEDKLNITTQIVTQKQIYTSHFDGIECRVFCGKLLAQSNSCRNLAEQKKNLYYECFSDIFKNLLFELDGVDIKPNTNHFVYNSAEMRERVKQTTWTIIETCNKCNKKH